VLIAFSSEQGGRGKACGESVQLCVAVQRNFPVFPL